MMKRTTIMLPLDMKTRAERRAKKMGVSLGAFIRESLQKELESPGRGRTTDTLFEDTPVYQGKAPDDMSCEHDKYLYGKEK